ncbi:PREDICTED: Retrovirus-related Pol poly from transposon, partial [Prunus dulcis]
QRRQNYQFSTFSKALQSAELRYPPLEQLALALVVSARRLRPYFQAHGIKVLTNQPLRQVLQKPEISGRLIKWAIELGEFDIQFVPRPAEKGQAVADFISELTPATVQPTSEAITETILPDQPGAERLDTSTPVWGLHVDGSANQQGCGAGL